jgi:hypothetical protein
MAYVPYPTGADVAAFLGRGDDEQTVSLAGVHVGIVLDLARAYTRDKGFISAEPPYEVASEIASVVVMATARVLVNPEQVKREAFGDYQVTPGTLYGWTLVEVQTLNRFRTKNSSGPKRTIPEWPTVLDGGEV